MRQYDSTISCLVSLGLGNTVLGGIMDGGGGGRLESTNIAA